MDTLISLADSIEQTSKTIRDEVEKQSENVAKLIEPGSQYAKSMFSPLPKPVEVDERVRKAAQQFEQFSGHAASISAKLVYFGGLVYSVMSTGLTPIVSMQYRFLLPTQVQYLWDKILIALRNLFSAIRLALTTISVQLGNVLIDLLGHRYGDNVKQVLQTVANSIGNFFAVLQNSYQVSFAVPPSSQEKSEGKETKPSEPKESTAEKQHEDFMRADKTKLQ